MTNSNQREMAEDFTPKSIIKYITPMYEKHKEDESTPQPDFEIMNFIPVSKLNNSHARNTESLK